MNSVIKLYFGLILLTLLILFGMTANAQGDLLLYPKRIVFEGSKRFQVLNLANTGKDTVKYLVSVLQLRMTEAGKLEAVNQPDSGQRFADKFFRFFPRHVTLAPKEAQTIKIQLINTSDLEPGEYRSHIYFRAETDKKPLGEKESVKDDASISVNLVAVFGISIPVIIRVGESSTQVNFSDLSFSKSNDSIPILKFDLNRSGNMSVYGDIAVDHISAEGRSTRVGVAKGVGLYTPNQLRHFTLVLDEKTGINYSKGKLLLTYITQPDAKSVKIAETEFGLNSNSLPANSGSVK